MERAVAVVLKRSTASLVPSPTRFPKATDAPSAGGSISRASSASSSRRRMVSARRTWSVSMAMGHCAPPAGQGSSSPQVLGEQDQYREDLEPAHDHEPGEQPHGRIGEVGEASGGTHLTEPGADIAH